MASDYYETLGVPRTASADELKSAYVKKARENHPDLHPGDKEAEARFKDVQHAYDVLGNEEKRRQYDQFGPAFEQAGMGGGPRGGAGGPWSFHWGGGGPGGAGGFDFSGEGANDLGGIDIEELLRQATGGPTGGGGRARSRARSRRKPPAEEAPVDVDFLTAARGGTVELRIQRPDDGALETISVQIPAGIAEGAKLRVKGKGSGGADIHLLVHVLPHPYFRREGQDIIVETPISVSEAILGGKVDVPTIDGTITLKVPPGSSSGKRLRLRERGLPTPDQTARGDQYVELRVMVPPTVDDKSRELMEEFAKRNPQDPRAGLGWTS
jgi:DnaJ-class molecular chaperone